MTALALLLAVAEALEAAPVDRDFSASGYLRVRTDLFYDLDLNVGTTPSGQSYFPTSAANPADKTLTAADMRLRIDPRLDLGLGVRIRARVDVLDNVGLGSTPVALPASDEVPYSAGATAQKAPADSLRVKRIWGEVTLPIGILAAGRMGALVSWGTGMFVNSGDCLDCDFGDAGDRIAFETWIADHLFLLAYDLAAVGPGVVRFGQLIDLDRSDDVRTIAFAVGRVDDARAVARKLVSGRPVWNYGLLASYRWQSRDAPGWYQLPPVGPFGSAAYVERDLRTGAFDGWGLYQAGPWRAEAEAVLLRGRIGDASPVPGVAFRQAITQTQVGAVARLERLGARIAVGAELGYASGDSAPGFGVRIGALPVPGDLDGGQAHPPGDTTVDNFLFNRDYRIDLILWRRIIGRITDALYVRPRLEWRPARKLVLEGNLVYSQAMEAASTPSVTSTPLGVEVDLSARYLYDAAFEARLAYGVLAPLDGLRLLGRAPAPAQTIHFLTAFKF
ncbi:MAG TPA: TIGR04551 family protein [Polyangia bacterium]|nr:TIGR04551 family protein [Polyangia bacterium]